MAQSVFERVLDLLRKQPDYIDVLRKIVEYEKKHKDDQYFEELGWEWSDVQCDPVRLFRLFGMEILQIAYKSRSHTGYLLVDREETERALRAAELEREAILVAREKPIEVSTGIFDDVVGYDDVKELLLKGIERRVHFLLIGAPASATGDTEVIVRNSEGIQIKPISELFELWNSGWRFEALSINPETLKSEWKSVTNVICHGERNVVKLSLRGGRSVKITKDHSLFKFNGRLVPARVSELKVGDAIPVVYRMSNEGYVTSVEGIRLTEGLGFSIGLWLAEGSLFQDGGRHMIEVSNSSDELLVRFAKGIKEIEPDYRPYRTVHKRKSKRINSKKAYDFFMKFVDRELYEKAVGKGKTARAKLIPPWIYIAPSELKRALVEGFFIGDACKKTPNFNTASKKLRDGMLVLLMQFGIPATLGEDKGHGKYSNRIYYCLRIPQSFRNIIGEITKNPHYTGSTQHDEIVRVPLVTKPHVRGGLIGMAVAKRLLSDLEKVTNADVFWDTVESIKEIGVQTVYDLSVEGNENFVTSDGILLHNSSKTLILLCLEKLPQSKYILGSRASKSGLSDYLINFKPKILLIDEIDKMRPEDMAVLLSLMETGRVSETLYGRVREVQLDTVVFAAANTLEGMPEEVKSRFRILRFGEYTRDEFMNIVKHILRRRGVDEKLAVYIAEQTWDVLESKDPREAIRLAKLAKDKSEVDRIVKIFQRYK